MFGQNFASPPNMPSPSDNMYAMDGLDDNSFGIMDDANPTFDPNDFLNSDLMSSPMPNNAQLNFGSPAAFLHKVEHAAMPQFQPRSAVSSQSPESSAQDSSSDSSGRRKRKSPSGSSPEGVYGSYPSYEGKWVESATTDERKRRTKVDSPVFKQEDGVGMLNNSMTESFNIKSAGNSPPAMANTPSTTRWNMGTPRSMTDQDMNFNSNRKRSPFHLGGNSRDNTPPSVMSFDSTHNTPFLMMRDSPETDGLTFSGARTPFRGMGDGLTMFTPPIQTTTNMSTVRPDEIGRQQVRLHVSPLGNKSRVETQIPIKLTLDPLPPGVKRLHLPTETIAKAKFLAKETPPSPDTLELSAMLVCTSAMEKPTYKAHAFQIAREGSHLTRGTNPRRSSTGDAKKGTELDPSDPDSPINGGPVRICDNCVSRERKRAGRKKAKKQEDEERWHEFERDRIVMFNTQEYLDFHPPTPAKEPQFAETATLSHDAYQVDAPMRIVCYCRHQQEKIGFQVIFTVRDWQGHIIAQTMTQSILITDDHKTHTHGTQPTANATVADSPQYSTADFAGSGTSIQPQGLPGRAYHSSTNLAAMSNQGYWSNMTNGLSQGQTGATSLTPRNLSRPASPSGHIGPKKKRKGSGGPHKIPAGLMMTRSDLEPLSIPSTTSAPQAKSVLSPDMGTLSFDIKNGFTQPGPFNTTPPTPDASAGPIGNDKMDAASYFYSAPNSAHQSRAPSPTSFARNSMLFQTPTGTGTASFTGMQFGTNDTLPTPNIFKIRPDRGSITGNIEVVILGKNFHRNLEVMFGDNVALTTTYWNSDTLVCLLPPAIVPGPVAVTFARPGYSPPSMSSPPMFTYVDDTKQQLFELAIQLQCNAQLGPGADHFQFAQTILAGSASSGPFSAGKGGGFGGNMLSNGSTEDLLLAMINKVDMIDSIHTPYYDHQREGGVTMLSLACRLGFERLVAALLIRGADPDVADLGRYTPLMYAAAHGHVAIVRRLILRGADPSLRNLRGLTAVDLASTPEVRHHVRHRRHYRSVSAGTPYLRSRANSAASTRSLWGPPSSGASSTMYSTEDESAVDTEEVEEVDIVAPIPQSALASRRPSIVALRSRRGSEITPQAGLPVPANNGETAAASTMAMLSQLRDQLTHQINALQQNLPSMQLSDLLQDQNLPALGRRFSSLVPMRRDGPPARTGSPSTDPPPPYHEACPSGVTNDFDTKPPELFSPVATGSSSSASVATVRPAVAGPSTQTRVTRQRKLVGKVTIGKTSPTGEEAAELRRMRQEKLTPAKYDTNLWTLWFPLLIVLIIWYFSGLQAPPVMSWLKSFNETVADTFGRALPALPDIPNVPQRMRFAPAPGMPGVPVG